MTYNNFIDEDLIQYIQDCSYIQECTSNKQKDPDSLSYLIDIDMTQSDKIKLGTGCEKLLSDIILKKTSFENIKKKNKKGKKETDHLFVDNVEKKIYYAELKGNLNLDTEKSKATYKKCLSIVEELKKEYKDYEVKWCLVNLRYLDYDNIPATTSKKYDIIKDNVFGINQYLELLNIKIIFNDATYKEFLNKIANAMFSN